MDKTSARLLKRHFDALSKIIGRKFGLLTAIRFHSNENRQKYYVCRCDCGKECLALAGNLRNGHTNSCGCAKLFEEHGMSGTRTYNSYQAMLRRCHDESDPSYEWYGARGVTVCAYWRESFLNFYSDMGDRPEETSLDRIDPEGNYEFFNCRWADKYTQANNRRPKN